MNIACMPLDHVLEHRDGYARVTLSGNPPIEQFLAFVRLMEAETRAWRHDRALFDLRGISTLRHVTEQVAIGQAVARHLRHMDRIASLVPPDRVTGISRKAAQQAGLNLAVFVDEQAAIAWLLADAGAAGSG